MKFWPKFSHKLKKSIPLKNFSHTCSQYLHNINVNSLSQVVSDKLLYIRDTAWGTVECQLVSGTKFRFEPILSPQTAKMTEVH